MHLRSSRFVDVLNKSHSSGCFVATRGLYCFVEIRAAPATVVAEIMFVPDKVMNREKTHLADDRRVSISASGSDTRTCKVYVRTEVKGLEVI